jgi:hypothetical protein
MNGDYRSLHVYQIVLAQSAHPFSRDAAVHSGGCVSRGSAFCRAFSAVSNECAIPGEYVQRHGVLEFGGIQQIEK